MHRYDPAHTGHAADEAGPTTEVTDAWRYATCGASAGPIVGHGAVHVGRLRVDGQTGRPLGGAGEPSMPAGAMGADRYYSNHDSLEASDPESGETLWAYDGVDFAGIPTVAGGTVYQCGKAGDPTVYAVNSDGTEAWTFTTESDVNTPPAVSDGCVFVVDRDNVVYAIQIETGTLNWKVSRWETIQYSPPAVSDGTLFVGSWEEEVFALRTSDGSVRWTQRRPGFTINSAPAVTADAVYVTGRGGNVAALDTKTGAVLWEETYLGGELGTPTVAGDTLYTGSVPASQSSTLLALDTADGSERWHFETRTQDTGHSGVLAGIVGSPAVVDGVVFVATAANDIYALTASD